ncbi:hypothetical protein Q5P01_026069 [Channa striata]|uniref:C3H1-type domain-containing protein n=1 Tax=Channa striata TaxID=64152 RepID=A0AA88IKA9_CHASR|nr:hypothetical protein Q5P01_026069 [Channa striata]
MIALVVEGRGKCSQGLNCRFSHEPLNELTNQLLDEALKRDSQCYELALPPQQESPGERETEMTPDVVMQPVRPSFYNSEETDAEQKALLCQTEEQSDDLKEAVPPCPPPHSSLSAESDNQEPVCYSVEAVLGRSLFKPFPSFSTTPQSQESTCLSVEKSSGCSPDSANQSDAPYSVVAVLRSYKSAESSTFGPTLTRPAAKTVSFNPKSDCAEATDSLLSSDTQNGKVVCSGSSRTEDSKDQGKLFKSLPSHKIYHRSTLESRDLKKPAPCGSRPHRFTTQAQQQQQSSTLSHRSSAAAAPPTSSVLKTLFLRLSPYQQDGQQQDRVQRTVPPEVKKNQSSVETIKDKQTSKREGRQKKKLEAQDSHTQTQKSIQNTQFPLEATGGSNLCSPVRTEPQLRNFGTHNSPFKAVMPPVQHRTPPRKENG